MSFLNLNLIRFAIAHTTFYSKLNSPVARVVPRKFSTIEIIPLIYKSVDDGKLWSILLFSLCRN